MRPDRARQRGPLAEGFRASEHGNCRGVSTFGSKGFGPVLGVVAGEELEAKAQLLFRVGRQPRGPLRLSSLFGV